MELTRGKSLGKYTKYATRKWFYCKVNKKTYSSNG